MALKLYEQGHSKEMKKFLAVVKREYVQRVRSKLFAIVTVLGPVILVVFAVVPGLLFSIKAGGDTRLAIVDQTEGMKLYQPLHDSLMKSHYREDDGQSRVAPEINASTKVLIEKTGKSSTGSFSVEQPKSNERSVEDLRRDLNSRLGKEQLDGYLVIPADILTNSGSKPAYYGRHTGDFITQEQIEQRLNEAVRRQRLIESGVKEQYLEELAKPVELITYTVNEKGEAELKDSDAGLVMVFVAGVLIYLIVLLYGQVILGAVVEEKETRIAEILFSSVRPFTLMFGKLIGVSLVALTQLAIWTFAFALLSLYGMRLAARGIEDIIIPHLPPLFFVCFFLFFILGYFLYATLYVVLGSLVTTTEEGGQLTMPIVFLLMAGLYMAFPVIRSPNSSFAVWVSMFPFFSPITMIVRIVTQPPPLWQIALSLMIGAITVVLLVWLAARIYRVGMLMYGKRASIPEVWRWVRQA
jgi:ABC-2 type transport system permease protein